MTNVKLRKQGREARKSLAPAYRRKATQRLNMQLTLLLRRYRRIALYLHFDGEPDVLPTIAKLYRSHHRIYLPVLQKRGLCFVSVKALRKARINRFGIIEPSRHAKRIGSKRLQAIVLPLTAYDHDGNRLGMGAGFYDRALSWKKAKPNAAPTLIGCAWACQQFADIEAQPWDIPLNQLCNENQTLRFRN